MHIIIGYCSISSWYELLGHHTRLCLGRIESVLNIIKEVAPIVELWNALCEPSWLLCSTTSTFGFVLRAVRIVVKGFTTYHAHSNFYDKNSRKPFIQQKRSAAPEVNPDSGQGSGLEGRRKNPGLEVEIFRHLQVGTLTLLIDFISLLPSLLDLTSFKGLLNGYFSDGERTTDNQS